MVLRLSSWSKNYRSHGQSRRTLYKTFVYNSLRTIYHSPLPYGPARPNPILLLVLWFFGLLG
jgi:hypothetical protein